MRHSLLVFAAAIALTASGCDTTGINGPGGTTPGGTTPGGTTPGGTTPGGTTPGGTTPGGGTTPARTFAQIDPAATYLRTDAGTPNAAAVRLADYGLQPGETACFRAVGDADLGGGALASADAVRLTGAFSATSDLSAPLEPNRIKDVIDGDWFIQTLPQTSEGLQTEIDEDFDATNDCWPVPTGAAYVYFSAYDGYFVDNADVNAGGQPFGVLISKR